MDGWGNEESKEGEDFVQKSQLEPAFAERLPLYARPNWSLNHK